MERRAARRCRERKKPEDCSRAFNSRSYPLFQGKHGETGPTHIARVILNNLNIFGSKQHVETAPVEAVAEPVQKRKTRDSVLDVDSSSTKSGRRPSVDTVSTYLSHENPVDLLDSSVGSDDAFKDSVVGEKTFLSLHSNMRISEDN